MHCINIAETKRTGRLVASLGLVTVLLCAGGCAALQDAKDDASADESATTEVSIVEENNGSDGPVASSITIVPDDGSQGQNEVTCKGMPAAEPEDEVLHLSVCDCRVPEAWRGQLSVGTKNGYPGECLLWDDCVIAWFEPGSQQLAATWEDAVAYGEANLRESYSANGGLSISIYEGMLNQLTALVSDGEGNSVMVSSDCWFETTADSDEGARARAPQLLAFLASSCGQEQSAGAEAISLGALEVCAEGIVF